MQSKRARIDTPSSSEDDTDADAEVAPQPRDSNGEAGGTATTPSLPLPVDAMGVIERVDMINFMCHRHLSIRLGPRINFIIGHNGSGKSAILTAITIALGGKANTTSRGSSLKDFIREGASAGEVRVLLRNHGADAFRADVYGDAITIERRLHADGGGAWKIRSADGRVVSTRREELDAICDHANIQVDNPMNILSQDAARQFLGSSQAEDKYSFFLRGTQLTQLAQEYELIQTNIQRMRRAMTLTEDALPDLERAARDANARWQEIEQMRRAQEKLDALKEELVWSQVIAKEKELAGVAEKLERTRAKLGALERRRGDDAAQAASLDDVVAELELRSRESHEREAQLKEHRARVLAEIKEQRASLASCKTQERQLNEQADRIQHTLRQLQSQIDVEVRRQAQDRRAVRQGQEAQRDALVRERLDTERRLVALEQAAEDLVQQRSACQADRTRLVSARQVMEEKMSHLRSFLQRCRDAERDRITAFGGPDMPRVMAAIDRETQWRDKPIGPLGMHIRLTDLTWAPLVESVLADPLNAFIVTNHDDRARLARILRACHATNQIITAAPDAFDYSSGEPDASVLTMLRVMEMDDVIARVLIDAQHIEKSALVRARAAGDALVRQHKRNVQQCYSADLFKITGGPKGSSTQTVTRYQGAPRFARDSSAQRAEAEAALVALDRQAAEVDAQLVALTDRERAWREDERVRSDDMAQHRQTLRELRRRIAQIEDQLREDEPANVAALEEARAEAEEDMRRVRACFQETEAQKEALEAALVAPLAQSEDLLAQIDVVESNMRKEEEELQTKYTERVRLQKTQEHWTHQMQLQQAAMDEAQHSEAALARLIDTWTVTATEYCARVETQRTPEALEEQIRLMEAHMAAATERSELSVESVVRELRARNKAFQDAKQQLENTRATIALLDRAIQLRLEKWHYFRRFVAVRARANFALHLQNRGFSGSLHFDHNAQTLKLRVRWFSDGQVHTGDSTQPMDKDPKALSGGEKSFATICLLLSLWEAIGCPIRCLDEFDVFMDAVNRQVSMKMIVDAARASVGVQYILITPQNMANVSLGP
ncbi:unnamed protein product [Malassezia sympodialis ATCC 42132]|uniref:uncharacterized protein n=1 Tax=Malassezia sympodialis (strain ATCC 42132) TaxID=1230383 RepID=UPI0002C2D9E6|nr:uncharacterized protein MSY001_2084 [Malassezia sympodialis ATCC 42132]CCU99378.1 unnamed protein product [Malassezia sympodialis ATCC 42132]|eukprot:XP_018740631.1 uncharacterized protein MSY001_2084 [Malassezia sympodialis ATCC 42132]